MKDEESHRKSRKMFFVLILCQLLVLNPISLYCFLSTGAHGQNQGFIQSDNEFRYLVDGVSIHMHEPLSEDSATSFTDLDEENLEIFEDTLKFDPPELDFKHHPLGMPRIQKVTVFNPNSDFVLLFSISGSSHNFHGSFFNEKILLPGWNVTFEVVFLPWEEGPVETVLNIHSSLGNFKYQAKGIGTPNPYRLKPFLGVKIPLHSNFSPSIEMYNPHNNSLQITEMYSSGVNLHLELPSGEFEGPSRMWEIPPYETRTIMKVNFLGKVEKNHTLYIRIKTNLHPQESLIIPVEVEVTSQSGLYCPQDSLDFGIIRSQDEPKSLPFKLLNSGSKLISVNNVIVTPVNDAVVVDFKPIKIAPDTEQASQVAAITFNPAKALSLKQYSGRIVVKSKQGLVKVSVPYYVQMLHGSLEYNTSLTRFYVKDTEKSRSLSFTSLFNVPLMVYNYSLMDHADIYFMVQNFTPTVLLTGKNTSVLVLTMRRACEEVTQSALLRLHTNISHFDIPLLCYTGRLRVVLPLVSEGFLDLGTLGMGDRRDVYFAVVNDNPIEVKWKSWGSNLSRSNVELVGVEEGNVTPEYLHKVDPGSLPRSLVVESQHFAVFRLEIHARDVEGLFYAHISLHTDFEDLFIPFRMRVSHGRLTSGDLTLERAYPGKSVRLELYIHSTFPHPMKVTSVRTHPSDPRFTFVMSNGSLVSLETNKKSFVGELMFKPQLDCDQECYCGFRMDSSTGVQWLMSMLLPPSVSELDNDIYSNLRNKYTHPSMTKPIFNVTLHVDTNHVKGFQFQAQARLVWPQLVKDPIIKFPLTQIGNSSIYEILLENPSDLPVMVQLVPAPMYPGSKGLLASLYPNMEEIPFEHLNWEDEDLFTILATCDVTNTKHMSSEDVANLCSNDFKMRLFFLDEFSIVPHLKSVPLHMPPKSKLKLKLAFTPRDDSVKASVLYLRNNMSVIEALVLKGQGAYGQMKFGNRWPGSKGPLKFQLAEKHLKDCERTRNKYIPPNFTVKRAFIARNTGEILIYISGFDINGSPCEGYGFRVLDCEGFYLSPNSSKKIDIAFTPDFTLDRIERTLSIHTSVKPWGTLNFTLFASVPSHMLSICSAAIPRPSWEPIIYYAVMSFMVFLLFCVLAAAFFESDRILKFTYVITTTVQNPDSCEEYDKSKIFNLKALGKKEETYSGASYCPKVETQKKDSVLTCRSHKNKVKSSRFQPELNGSHEKRSSEPNGVEAHVTASNNDLVNNVFPSQAINELSSSMLPLNSKSKKRLSRKNSSSSSSDKLAESPPTSRKLNLTANAEVVQPLNNHANNIKVNVVAPNVKSKPNVASKQSVGTVTDFTIISHWLSPTADKPKKVKNQKKSDEEKSSHNLYFEEETSSTTTESSAIDELTDKDSKADGNDRYTKVRKSKESYEEKENRDNDENAKYKLHKTYKSDSCKTTDIIRPTSLDLSNKVKPSKDIDKDKKLKPKKSARVKGIPISTDQKRSSPLPVWDPPSTRSHDEGMRALASQTEIFAYQQKRVGDIIGPRAPSYSAIVSSGEKLKARVAPMSKTNVEARRNVGVVGQRPVVNPVSPWSFGTSLDSSCPPDVNLFTPSSMPMDLNSMASASDGVPDGMFPSTIGGLNYSQTCWKNLNILQSLQAEDESSSLLGNCGWPCPPVQQEDDLSWSNGDPTSSVSNPAPNSQVWATFSSPLWSSSLWPSPLNDAQDDKVEMDNVDPKFDSETDCGLGFDPFRSVTTIWSPRTPVSPETAWSQSLFTQEDK